MCWTLGFKEVLVESNSKVVTEAVVANQRLGACPNLCQQLFELINKDWRIQAEHVYGEANMCADHMAAIRMKQTKEMMEWVGPPRSIEKLFEEDRNGIGRHRRMAVDN